MGVQWRDDSPSNVHVIKAARELGERPGEQPWDAQRAQVDAIYADVTPAASWTASRWRIAGWFAIAAVLWAMLFFAGVGVFGVCAGWL